MNNPDISRIASLSRIELTEDEAIGFEADLVSLEAFADVLSGIAPQKTPDYLIAVSAAMREDVPESRFSRETMLKNLSLIHI